MKNYLEPLEFSPAKRMFLICEKCGAKKMINDENASIVFKKWMKEKLKEKKLQHELRPVLSSCLGVCPENLVTGALIDNADVSSKFFLLDLNKSKEGFNEILDNLLSI